MRLPFEIDPQIIHHIIHSQAGSIGKAVIELIMNCVDASAANVRLVITRDGFECVDDGKGFVTREDVLRYFGRFGTPHIEGDAVYGRFRLGRGQIMAHASTVWSSNAWVMEVDTKVMGHTYELTDAAHSSPGCRIVGTWYERLSEEELQSTLQEIRDLVRYTPVKATLNGTQLTRDPESEKWDFVDETAYYRVRKEGAVSIYNQGVLVRHDAGSLWGAGGIIVSKPALALNVSRSEVLRKTCPVWAIVAKRFGAMAAEMSESEGTHRKSEDSRTRSAASLLSNAVNILTVFEKDEVITVLPGARHITLNRFLRGAYGKELVSVVESVRDIPKAERLAQSGVAMMVHPKTLQRFQCYSVEEFVTALERIVGFLHERAQGTYLSRVSLPRMADCRTLLDSFVERTKVVASTTLNKEDARAWRALRWCCESYAAACLGHGLYPSGRAAHPPFRVVLGESNTSEAWTDGESYIALNIELVKKLNKDPLKSVSRIFSIIEHEVSHQGDSLDSGHDEAFYQRYHDISLAMSETRQRFVHIWIQKLTYSMELDGKRPKGDAWRERFLVERAGDGRRARGMGPLVEANSPNELMSFVGSEDDLKQHEAINVTLVQRGRQAPPPDWEEVMARAVVRQKVAVEESRAQRKAYDADIAAMEKEWMQELAEFLNTNADQVTGQRERIAAGLGRPIDEVHDDLLVLMWTWSEVDIAEYAASDAGVGLEPSEFGGIEGPGDFGDLEAAQAESRTHASRDALERLDAQMRALVRAGETAWSLERNAAAAGFHWLPDYLNWRNAQ